MVQPVIANRSVVAFNVPVLLRFSGLDADVSGNAKLTPLGN